jgi:hypothetical protein
VTPVKSCWLAAALLALPAAAAAQPVPGPASAPVVAQEVPSSASQPAPPAPVRQLVDTEGRRPRLAPPRLSLRTSPVLTEGNRGHAAGVGWSLIIAGPQAMAWSYPFWYSAVVLFDWVAEHGTSTGLIFSGDALVAGIGATLIAVAATGGGVLCIIGGISRVTRHPRASEEQQAVQAYDAGLYRGMGVGLMITGGAQALVSGLFLVREVTLLFGDEEAGRRLCYVMLGLGGAQLVAGGVMTLVGHLSRPKPRQVSVAPLVTPGGGALVVSGRF